MDNNIERKIEQMKELLKEAKYLGAASAGLYWDMAIMAPEKSVAYRGEVLGYLSAQSHKIITGDKMKELIDALDGVESLTDIERAMVDKCKRIWLKESKIPEKMVREFSKTTAESSAAWEKARAEKDFEIFKPHLEKVVNHLKKQIDILGYEGHKYNTLLDDFERGMTVDKLDEIFGNLRNSIVELLGKINNSDVKVDKKKLCGEYTEESQKEFSEILLKDMGYDFSAGRLDTSAHPFTIGMEPNDVRITTRYNESDFTEAIFGCIHEGGHALYEQGIGAHLSGTGLDQANSAGIHESQSLFYESIVGASEEYWSHYYGKLKEYYPSFNEMEFEDFYKNLNEVKPSFIRVEADELTYCLHIIIRYEIEKALFNDEIEVEDLPRIWNEKYQEYLGITPENDGEGVLQDMHWSEIFGYFPSYAIGRVYSAQFMHYMKKDIPNVMEQIAKGDLSNVLNWLREKVHKHGDMCSPEQLVKNATGEGLNPEYFVEYLNKKYSKIYNL